MAIALMSFNGLFGPLQAAVEWLAGGAPARRAPAPAKIAVYAPADAPVSIASCARPARTTGQFGLQKARTRPLRVLRVVDAAHAPANAGRMVISGRMADVCAELDRLAALEAAGR
ncbi:MAG: hypothetical protein EOO54_10960 [Haliea sp.]|nr:MAG: hypothetical protein EOO54_10960 [Haliea sp.]